ncbi:hypothetical protein ACIGZJ_27815 [Kitasatospora sp. NPDC052868]|uniref:hypothetical protein n=1 Tax=Kitasatospora sp. NPDC052868 TaxID=3364060 RepID=UPI0037C629E0
MSSPDDVVAELFADRDYSGRSMTVRKSDLVAGVYGGRPEYRVYGEQLREAIGGRAITSLRVAEGYEVALYDYDGDGDRDRYRFDCPHVLNAFGDRASSFTVVGVNPPAGAATERLSDGPYHVVHHLDHEYFLTMGPTLESGVRLQRVGGLGAQRPEHGRWQVTATGSGAYTFRNTVTGRYLGAPGGAIAWGEADPTEWVLILHWSGGHYLALAQDPEYAVGSRSLALPSNRADLLWTGERQGPRAFLFHEAPE